MKEIKTAKELHSILLNIGKEFHRICTKHNIPYYMLGGTMLGAIRHNGIIPWDDDMDFGVPRQYFEQLKNLLQKELPEPYNVLSVQNSDQMILDIIKIQNYRTIINELFKESQTKSFGINIDIFPLDRTPYKQGSPESKKIDKLKRIQQYRFLSIKSRPFTAKILAILVKIVLFPISRMTIINYINKNILVNKGDYVANHYGAWGERETVSKSVFGTPRLYTFNDTGFYGVEHPDEYLSALYGNYMELPPEDKRHIHILEMYWK